MDTALLEISYTLVAVVLLYSFVQRSLGGAKRRFANWFAFGFIFNLYSLSWLYTAYPLPWLSSRFAQLAGISLLLVVLAALAGASFTVVGFAFTHTLSPWRRVLAFTSLLTLAEIVRSLLFSVLFAGNGGRVGLHWTSGTLGNALSSTPLIEYAYFGGVYALTAILGLLVITLSMRKQLRYWYGASIFVLVGVIIIHYAVPVNTPRTPLRVAIITTDFTKTVPTGAAAEEFMRRAKVLDAMTQTVKNSAVDVVAYPEDAQYTKHLTNEEITLLSQNFPTTLFVDGDTRVLGGNLSNFSLFYSPDNRAQIRGRGKVFLFPFSEYLPVVVEPLFKMFLTDEEFANYKKEHSYVPQQSIQTTSFNGERVGTLLCSEIVSYETIQHLSRQSPSLVIFQSYLSVFNGREWFAQSDRSFSKVAAAQLRTPFLSSTNGAESYVISPYGKVLSIIPRGFKITLVDISAETMTVSQ